MPDMGTVAGTMQSLKAAIDIGRFLKDSNLSIQSAEHKLKMAELMSALADVKIEIASIQELLIQKDRALRELQEALSVKQRLRYEAPYYWLVDGAEKDGPYCQQCYDSDRKLVRLQSHGRKGLWQCMTCKNYARDSAYERDSDPPPARSGYFDRRT